MSIENISIGIAETTILTGGAYAAVLLNFCNYSSTTDVDITVYAVKGGGAGSTVSQVIKQRVPAGTTFLFNVEKFLLDTTDKISAIASVAGTVNCTISYMSLA